MAGKWLGSEEAWKQVDRHRRAGRWPVKQTSWLKGRQVDVETDIQQEGRQANV